MIRIAMFAHLSEVSGAGVALLDSARFLDKSRFETTFIVPGEGPLAERARGFGIEPVVIPNPEVSMKSSRGTKARVRLLWKRASYMARVRRFLKKQSFQLAYISSTASIFAGVAARMAQTRVIWHVHELIEHPSRATRLKLNVIERVAYGILYASQTAFTCFPAQEVKHKLVVKNWIDLGACAEPGREESLREELGIHSNEVMILSNGVFHRKGTDVLIEAAGIVLEKTHKPVRFVITGDPPAHEYDFAEKVHSRAKTLPSGSILFTGHRSDFKRLLRCANVYISPSRNEALPISILEAMAAGTPVIVTDVGDCGLLVQNGESGGLVPSENPQALANVILDLLANPEQTSKRAKQAQLKVAKEYGQSDFWKPLETFLENAVAGI